MIDDVRLSRRAQADLRRAPRHVAMKLAAWVEDVRVRGLEEVRKIPGFHDEPLKGQRQGQRSIRLSRGHRAIYRILRQTVEFVLVEEVSKHEY